MEPIRLATKEEVESIAATSDLTDSTYVVAFGDGPKTLLAVVRNAYEIDPMVSGPEVTGSRKAMFIWGLENMLRFQGLKQYYFNVLDSDEAYKKVVQSWGANPVSTAPEIRYKKVL